MLAFLAGARNISDDGALFAQQFDLLVNKHRFAFNLENIAINNPDDYAFFDDNLGHWVLRSLLYFNFGRNSSFDYLLSRGIVQWSARGRRARLADDAYVYALWYAMSTVLRQSMKIDAPSPQRQLDDALQVLREWPLDIVEWNVKNSDRWDLQRDAERPHKLLVPLPRDEICAFKWAHNAFMIDGCDGRIEADPKDFLQAYWMARFHSFFE